MRATILSFTPSAIGDILERTGWAIVSADRPPNPYLSRELNRRIARMRTGHLRRSLTRYDAEHYTVVGAYEGVDEDSSLILGIDERDALTLGVMYGQDTVLVPRGLLCCKTARLTPAIEVVSPVSLKEDHTYIFATGAIFAVRFAVPAALPNVRTA